jgi:hypothetical protein
MSKTPQGSTDKFWKGFVPAMVLLVLALAVLFHDSFKATFVQFANDGPLGVAKSAALSMPAALTGYWPDLNWLGANGATASFNITNLVLWFLGPVGYMKFYPPITLLLLGASAWIFFRTLKLSSAMCGVAAFAAALNMNFFSNTCWGLGSRSLTLASAFLALAALNTRRVGNPWINAVLGGLCTGLAVIEGADNGAIFSLFIAAFVIFQSWVEESTVKRRLVSCLRLGLVTVFAAIIAVQVLIPLTGVAARTAKESAAADSDPKAAADKQWVFATQWSLTPAEMLRVIIPGLFGYRMDTPEGGEYWGRVGEYWPAPEAGRRSSGAGEYAGVPVVLIGLWAFVQALRRGGGPKATFDDRERKYIFFWAAMFLVGMLLSWGHHAPFYRLVYSLPYFKTIRNPMKFMHPGHMALMILFAYGLLGLSRRYLDTALVNAGSLSERFKNWRTKALPVERRWFQLSVAAVAVSVLAFLAYSGAHGSLTRHLMAIGFPDETHAAEIARFSINEVGKFAVFLFASVAVVTLIQIGMFAGPRAKWAALLLGALLTIDLARADTPWIKPYDYAEQYASNPIIDVLRREPWLHRVAVFPSSMLRHPQLEVINSVWRGPWLQWLCQYYNIQSTDMSQEPRPPAEKAAYLNAVSRTGPRLWELTNTRYLLGITPLVEVLNQQMDPAQKRFRLHTAFALSQGPSGNISAQTNQTGPWALIEFTGALPRAALYTQWQVETNLTNCLNKLGDPAFNPHQLVLVNDPVPAPNATNAAPGTVEFVSYAPTRIDLKANATAPSILLLNDQFDRDWHVSVDGQPAQLLRCNYLMRGVQVPPGQHTILFRFQPSLTGMKITLAAFALGVLLCGFLVASKRPADEPAK